MGSDDGASGWHPRPKEQGREEKGTIRLVESHDGDGGSGASRRHARTNPRRRKLEELVKGAQVAVIVLRDGLRTEDLDERREWFLFARSELRKSIRLIEADLDRLPSSELGPWCVEEEKLKRMFEKFGRERRARKIGLTSGPSADGLGGRSA